MKATFPLLPLFQSLVIHAALPEGHVVPTFVGRKEVAIAFKTVKDALELLDKLGHLRNVPKVPYVRYGGELSFPFWRLIGRIQRSFLAQKT